MGLLDTDKYLPGRATSGDPHGVKLRQALREAGDAECALCGLLEDEENARLHWLAYEGLADGRLRKKLRDAGGFCPRHARALFGIVTGQTHNLSAIAQVMEELCAADLEALDKAAGGAGRVRAGRSAAGHARGTRGLGEPRGRGGRGSRGRRGRGLGGRLVAALRPAAVCPACEASTEVAARKVSAFAAGLDDEAFARLYVESDGALCRPHLLAALAEASDAGAALLVEKHAAGLRRDAAELAEFLRKVDHRFTHEPKGAEQRSPLRSLLRFIGTWPR